jgi:hypothetical protein
MLDAQLCLQLQFVHHRTLNPNCINCFYDLGAYCSSTMGTRVQLKPLTREYIQTSPTRFNPGSFARTCQAPITEVQTEDFCDLTSCWLVNSYRCFEVSYCLHLQRQCILQRHRLIFTLQVVLIIFTTKYSDGTELPPYSLVQNVISWKILMGVTPVVLCQ